jgi:flagellin-like hook-associated protein FlgL
MDAEDAQILRDYFQSIRDYIVRQANISIGDSRLFGGVKAQKDPFNDSGIYQGENLETKVPVSKGVELNTTFDGTEYLGTLNSGIYDIATDTAPQKIGVVKALDDIVNIIDGDALTIYKSENGFTSTDTVIASTSGTLTINYGSNSFSINYDADANDATNPSTLQEIVDAINSSPSNPGVSAFIYTGDDGKKYLGLAGSDGTTPVSVSDTGGLLTGDFDTIGDIIKLHGYYSEMGYANSTDPLVASTESGTLTISYGDKTFSINYDGDTTDNTNPSTLEELVFHINKSPSNPGVMAYVYQDKDGVYRLGLLGQEADKKISIEDSTGALKKRIGDTKAILETFDEGFNKLAQGRSRIGAQINVIEDFRPQHEYLQVAFSELISKFEDTDYVSVIAELEKTKTAYEALLASFNQNKDLSLLNFLK